MLKGVVMTNSAKLAERFCDSYVVSGGKCSYIILREVDIRDCKARFRLLQPSARQQMLTEINGMAAYQIRNKMAAAIKERGDNAKAIFHDLIMIFTEEAIKRCFSDPNIWLLNHNAHAASKRAAEESEDNRRRKLDRGGFELHRQIMDATRNMSASAFVRFKRSLDI